MGEGNAAYQKQVQIWNDPANPPTGAAWTANAGSNWIDFDFESANFNPSNQEQEVSLNRSGDGGVGRILTLTDASISIQTVWKKAGETGKDAQDRALAHFTGKTKCFVRYLPIGAGAGFPVGYATFLVSEMPFDGNTAGAEALSISLVQCHKGTITDQT